ncbi:MAG: T9SS type A sorting domain-containing protein [Bacteroidota bacterium]
MKTVPILFKEILVLSLLLFCTNLRAQVCVPDTAGNSQGVFPATLPNGCLNEAYQATVTIRVPADTNILVSGTTFFAIIDSQVVNDIQGLPPGITYSCQMSGCVILGGTESCILASGTPTQVGTYPIDIISTIYGTVSGVANTLVDTQQAFYTIIINSLSATTASTPADCDVTNGTASVTPTGTAPYTYSWSNGETTASISNLASGQYTVTVTDANSCSVTETVTVGNTGAAPQITLDNVGWTGCAEDGSGQINLTVTGGSPAYTYAWSSGQDTEDLSGLAEGNYQITVTDAAGCIAMQSVDIAAPPTLSSQVLIQTNNLCPGDNNGSISTTITGGVAPYMISWNTAPPVTEGTISNLPAGQYTMMVTDDIGCVKLLNTTITEPPAIGIQFMDSSETAAAAMNGSIEAIASGGTPPYTYSWSNGESTAFIDSLSSASYSLTITDANNCVFTDSVQLGQWAVGIENEFEAAISQLRISPNPSNGIFMLDLELSKRQELSLEVLDLQGKLLFAKSFPQSQILQEEILLDHLGSGLYFVRISSSLGSTSRKLMLR